MSQSDSISIMVAKPDINDTTSRTTVRDRLGIAPGEIVIVAPGRVHRLSGHRFAVWAASILKIAEMPVRLIIQDTGRYARNVAEFARMTGFAEQLILAGTEWPLSDLLSAADIALFLNTDGMLLCSRPFSGWHGQAQRSGAWPCRKPATANLPLRSRLTVPPTVNGKNTLLVRPDNPRQIAQAMLKIIEEKSPATVNDK